MDGREEDTASSSSPSRRYMLFELPPMTTTTRTKGNRWLDQQLKHKTVDSNNKDNNYSPHHYHFCFLFALK